MAQGDGPVAGPPAGGPKSRAFQAKAPRISLDASLAALVA
jgi:hypothetical protein